MSRAEPEFGLKQFVKIPSRRGIVVEFVRMIKPNITAAWHREVFEVEVRVEVANLYGSHGETCGYAIKRENFIGVGARLPVR